MEPRILRIYTDLGFGSTGVGVLFFVWLIGVLGLGCRVSAVVFLSKDRRWKGISNVELINFECRSCRGWEFAGVNGRFGLVEFEMVVGSFQDSAERGNVGT